MHFFEKIRFKRVNGRISSNAPSHGMCVTIACAILGRFYLCGSFGISRSQIPWEKKTIL